MESSKLEEEEGFLAESHITGKFPIPGERIDCKQYFSDFQKELDEFAEETKDLYTKPVGLNTESGLLTYVGEPHTFLFEPDKYFREYLVNCKKLNKNLVLNEDLATVKARKALSAWKNARPKYALYLFKPYDVSLRREPIREIIFQIKIYKPFLSKGRKEDIKIQQELWLRGSDTLSKLRDAIVCHLDYCGLEDVSENISSSWLTGLPAVKQAQIKFPSFFFFINRTFFSNSDKGVAEAKDFLERYHFGKFNQETLKTKLEDMTFDIGRPCVYQHLGQCEHVFVISDVRLRTAYDPVALPFLNATSNSHGKQCMLCNMAYAHWLVTNFAKLMLSRAFLCHQCFLSYCYVDNRKAGDFQAYQYFDPISFL